MPYILPTLPSLNHRLISFRAASEESLPWHRLRPTSTQKSPRTVPGEASTGFVAPRILLALMALIVLALVGATLLYKIEIGCQPCRIQSKLFSKTCTSVKLVTTDKMNCSIKQMSCVSIRKFCNAADAAETMSEI